MPPKAQAPAQAKGKSGAPAPTHHRVERDYAVYSIPKREPPAIVPIQNCATVSVALGVHFGLMCHHDTTVFLFKGKQQVPIPFFEDKTVLSVAAGSLCGFVACVDNLYVVSHGEKSTASPRRLPRGLDSREGLSTAGSTWQHGEAESSLVASLCIEPVELPNYGYRVCRMGVGRSHAVVLCEANYGYHTSSHSTLERPGTGAALMALRPKVFVLGSSGAGALGLGCHVRRTEVLTEVPFFCSHRVVSVAAGPTATFVITREGIFGFGENARGQLGVGHDRRVYEPQRVSVLDDATVDDIFVGAGTTCFLHKRTGRVYMCGDLYNGTTSYTPVEVSVPEPVRSLSVGASHCVFLTRSGRLYGIGVSGFGELGVAGTTYPTPTRISTFDHTTVLQVACSSHRTAVVCVEGLYVLGKGCEVVSCGGMPERLINPAAYAPSCGAVSGEVVCEEGKSDRVDAL
eukprot:PhM_4_TR8926/c0_g1_i1/m.47923/K19607/RPGR; X-linked retinitis pigmentosa GTPase regulator